MVCRDPACYRNSCVSPIGSERLSQTDPSWAPDFCESYSAGPHSAKAKGKEEEAKTGPPRPLLLVLCAL